MKYGQKVVDFLSDKNHYPEYDKALAFMHFSLLLLPLEDYPEFQEKCLKPAAKEHFALPSEISDEAVEEYFLSTRNAWLKVHKRDKILPLMARFAKMPAEELHAKMWKRNKKPTADNQASYVFNYLPVLAHYKISKLLPHMYLPALRRDAEINYDRLRELFKEGTFDGLPSGRTDRRARAEIVKEVASEILSVEVKNAA